MLTTDAATGSGDDRYASIDAYAEEVRAAGGTVVPNAAEPGVGRLAAVAAAAWARGEGISAETVRPVYIREPDAVAKRKEGA